jgi:hypothetical protein
MMIVKGRYDGRHVVLESPMPQGIPVNTPVKLVFDARRRTGKRPASSRSSAARSPKLPSLRSLKLRILAGSADSLAKAEANAMKLIGRPRL